MQPLLEVKNLTVEFRTEEESVRAVEGIAFSIQPGETVGVVGESGSGKSVSSLAIMRLIQEPPGRITSGEILYHPPDGDKAVDLLKLPQRRMRRYRGDGLAMIFQEPMTSLNPVYTCGNQVMEAIRQHKTVTKRQAREMTLDLFRQVQLPRPEAMLDSYPHQLSGGQKQRVMIAMAMSCQPQMLIADEPTTALDVTVQKTILELMAGLQQAHNMSLLFITHDLGVVKSIADRVLVMYQGKIVEEGPVRQIFDNPQHPYTKGLLACRPPLDRLLYRLPVMHDFIQENPETGEWVAQPRSVQEVVSEMTLAHEITAQRKNTLYSQPPILNVNGLKTWFPQSRSLLGKVKEYVKAVDDVSLEVYKGETLGLVGESGSGKTTLGRSILGLVEPVEGEIIYDNINLRKLSDTEMRRLRKRMQIIFQDPYSSLNPRITVGRAIMEPMQVHGLNGNDKKRRAKVMELLERVSLKPEHFNRYPHEFSGGQRQRISIARALAVEPEFIICDESVSALDVSVQAQVLNLLKDLQEEMQLTYIFITHDLSVVHFMADRIIVMQNGRVVEAGPTEQIIHHPQEAYTQHLIAAVPV